MQRVSVLVAFVFACVVICADGRLHSFARNRGRLQFRAPESFAEVSALVGAGDGEACCNYAGKCLKQCSQQNVGVQKSDCDSGLTCCLAEGDDGKYIHQTTKNKCKLSQRQQQHKQQPQKKLTSWGKAKDNSSFKQKLDGYKNQCSGTEVVLSATDMTTPEKEDISKYKYPFNGGVPVGIPCCTLAAMAYEVAFKNVGGLQFMLGVAEINGHYYFAVSQAGTGSQAESDVEKLGLTNARKINDKVMTDAMKLIREKKKHEDNDWGCAAPWLVAAARLEEQAPACMAEVWVSAHKDHKASTGKVIASCFKCSGGLDKLYKKLFSE